MKQFKNFLRKRKIIVVLVLIGVLVLVCVFLALKKAGPDEVIELREDGFYPKELTIAVGETVQFKTSRNQFFWPASDVHPTHEIYSAFDPKKPIAANETWNFKFNKEGEWKYHDHITSYYRGVIKVVKDKSTLQKSPISICREKYEEESVLKTCWESTVRDLVKNEGVDRALEAVAALYREDPEFAKDCHAYTHSIGQEASKLYLQQRDFEVGEKTGYCGYGFYHGFMESLLTSGGDINLARSFCDFVDKQLISLHAGKACYHGIGHGTADFTNPATWGSEYELTRDALKLCKQVADSDEKLYLCGSGVFNSLSNGYVGERYGLKLRQNDPLWFCKSQEEGFKKSCYTQMTDSLMRLANNDFVRTMKYIEDIREDVYAQAATLTLLSLIVKENLDLADYGTYISECRVFQSRLYDSCIEGIAGGLIEFGSPSEEYSKAFDFCKGLDLDGEKKVCIAYLLRSINSWYSEDKLKDICKKYNLDEFKTFCGK